ncbi:hypothetical protein ENKO_17380 [Enterobacter kobei]|uniref:Uncharacterized protein n=2 Tax=Enterobacter kobei TaxID=208224 RepID=A0AA86IPC3_9ENTR|nr:hypothetical protein ENKO_17380 [Enterobacter kobei]
MAIVQKLCVKRAMRNTDSQHGNLIMTRSDIERYQRDSLIRAGFSFPRRGGDDTAQQIISNSERRRAKTKQKQEMTA